MDQPFIAQAVVHTSNMPNMENYKELFVKSLSAKDIILSKPQFFSSDVKSQYSHWHYAADYECMKQIVHEVCPEYDGSFSYVFDNNNGMSLYCMFVTRYEIGDNYFSWLFPLLFEAEKRLDVTEYSAHQKRVLAFLAERLLNVYVHHNRLNPQYEPIYFIDGERRIEKIISIKKIIKKGIKWFIPYGIIKLRERYKNR